MSPSFQSSLDLLRLNEICLRKMEETKCRVDSFVRHLVHWVSQSWSLFLCEYHYVNLNPTTTTALDADGGHQMSHADNFLPYQGCEDCLNVLMLVFLDKGCEDWGPSRYMLSRVCHMFLSPASLRNWAPARRHRSYSGSRTEVMMQSMAISLFITQAITKYNKSLLLA